MQDATENWQYAELAGESPWPELNLTFPLEHVSKLLVLAARMSSNAVDKTDIIGKKI